MANFFEFYSYEEDRDAAAHLDRGAEAGKPLKVHDFCGLISFEIELICIVVSFSKLFMKTEKLPTISLLPLGRQQQQSKRQQQQRRQPQQPLQQQQQQSQPQRLPEVVNVMQGYLNISLGPLPISSIDLEPLLFD
jgi:hypothetical protein